MEGMRDNLMCPIHQDLLENAKTLPCQHVVCEECIGLWVSKKGELSCPTCRKSHALPAGGVSNLPNNFMINGLVEEFKKLGKDGKPDRGRKHSSSDGKKKRKPSPSPQKPTVDPKKSFMEKKSKIYEDVCSSAVVMHVQLCDYKGGHLRKGESDRITVSVITPKGKKVGASVNYQRKEGIFLVTFVPKMCGVHRMEAMIGKQQVKGSPMMVVVHPEGKFLAGIRSQLRSPKDVLCDDYSLYITDSKDGPFKCTDWLGRPKIQVNTPQGVDVKDISPFGIAQAKDKMYVTDNDNNCIYIYKNGNYISSFGQAHLNQPMGITVNRNQVFYVANKGSCEISVFGPDMSHLKGINVASSKQMSSQPSLALLALNQDEDQLIIADQGNCCLQVVNVNESRVVNTISTRVGQAPAKPFGVAVDGDDNIYVTVLYNTAEQKRPGPKTGNRKPGPSTQGIPSLLDEEKGAVLMYNSEGYFLGRFGDGELQNPGGICILNEPSLTALVIDKFGSGHGSKGPGLKVFSI